MAITAADIKFRLSVAAAAGNTTAQGDPSASFGDQVSTTDLVDATVHNLFDKVTGDENVASDVEYRCLFVFNDHDTLTLENTVLWFTSEVAGGASVSVGVDPTAASAVDAAAQQAVIIADEGAAPAGVTWSAPTIKGDGIAIGNLAPNQVRAVWFRRTAANTGAVDLDGVTFRVEGDTAA